MANNSGILQLNAAMGSTAQGLQDETDEEKAQREINNIGIKSANKAEIGYIVGRGLSAGISTYKDYQKGKSADADSKTDSASSSPSTGGQDAPGWSTDSSGNRSFSPVKDFAKNFANPNNTYTQLSKAMRNQPVPAGVQTPPVADTMPGTVSTLHQDNAPIVGNIYQAMYPPSGGPMPPTGASPPTEGVQ